MNTTITKKDLVFSVADSLQQPRKKTKVVIQSFLDKLSDELKNGNRIEIRDFGIFEVKLRADRIARNPKTGEEIKVAARNVVTFKAGLKMKEGVL
uniref:Putative DNA binding protein n=1 Tax=viral metagenome TaxID=1070528 RepID=A0A6H1ZZI7_9ZZZZ